MLYTWTMIFREIFGIFEKKPKILVILGQTATGKTALSIEIAKRFNAEIVSADSRQVYKGMDIGTAKISKDEMQGIAHHMIDIADPSYSYTVAEFVDEAEKRIQDILSKKKLPIVCGGTGMYIDALVSGTRFPVVPPNQKLRAELELLSIEKLFQKLLKIDPRRAQTIDRHNKVRLVRALEIAKTIGEVPLITKSSSYDVLYIGLRIPKEELQQNITARIIDRFKNGMLEETKDLLESGVSHARLESFGLEYRYMSRYIREEITYKEMIQQLDTATRQFAKRQNTWFKRNKKIKWFHPQNNSEEIMKMVGRFLGK